MHLFVTLLGFAVGLQIAAAQVSLYVPGFDPQPLSAVALGVDNEGRTTWELSPGSTTNSDEDIGLIGTATLVEGSKDASLSYGFADLSFTLDVACTFSGAQAICSAIAGGNEGTTTFTTSESATRFVVQAVTTGITSPSTTSGGSASHTEGGSGSSPTESKGSSSAFSLRGYCASYTGFLAGVVGVVIAAL